MARLETSDDAQILYDLLSKEMRNALIEGWAFKEEKSLRSWRLEGFQEKTGLKAWVLVLDFRFMGDKIRVDVTVFAK